MIAPFIPIRNPLVSIDFFSEELTYSMHFSRQEYYSYQYLPLSNFMDYFPLSFPFSIITLVISLVLYFYDTIQLCHPYVIPSLHSFSLNLTSISITNTQIINQIHKMQGFRDLYYHPTFIYRFSLFSFIIRICYVHSEILATRMRKNITIKYQLQILQNGESSLNALFQCLSLHAIPSYSRIKEHLGFALKSRRGGDHLQVAKNSLFLFP